MTDEHIDMIAKWVGGILVGAGAVVAWIVKSGFWRNVRLHKNSMDFVSGMESLQRIFQTMARIQHELSARVLIFSGHNSGGLPRVGSGFWVSALHWVEHPRNAVTNFENYENISVDLQYMTMLLDAHREGSVFLKVSEMPSSLLRGYYEAEGVKQSLVIFLGIRERAMFYMSVARYEDQDDFTTMELACIKLACQPILNEFQTYSLT